MFTRQEGLKLPTGEQAASQDEYLDAWYRFAHTISRELKVRVLSYDSGGILFANTDGKTATISTWLAMKVYKAITGAYFSSSNSPPRICKCVVCQETDVDEDGETDTCHPCLKALGLTR